MPYCCLMISCSLESLRCYFVYSSGFRSSLGMIIKKGSCLEIGIFSLLFINSEVSDEGFIANVLS